MELKDYIGFKLDDIRPILDENLIDYEVIEILDTRNTKMGNDKRIINIKKDNDKIQIFVAYF